MKLTHHPYQYLLTTLICTSLVLSPLTFVWAEDEGTGAASSSAAETGASETSEDEPESGDEDPDEEVEAKRDGGDEGEAGAENEEVETAPEEDADGADLEEHGDSTADATLPNEEDERANTTTTSSSSEEAEGVDVATSGASTTTNDASTSTSSSPGGGSSASTTETTATTTTGGVRSPAASTSTPTGETSATSTADGVGGATPNDATAQSSNGGSETIVTNTTSETGASTTVSDALRSSSTPTNSVSQTAATSDLATTSTGTTPVAKASTSSTSGSTASPAATTTAGTASSTGTTTTIATGDAIVTANLINLLNSNFVNSEGALLFLDLYEALYGTIDLRNALSTSETTQCSLVACNTSETTVKISNDATIDNLINLIARTGSNSIIGADGAVIETGDAYANANVINVANTNIIDSEYLLVILNAFASLNGDIVFPSLLSYLSRGGFGGNAHLVNDAEIANDVTLEAETGGNHASTTNGSTIKTGAAATGANIFNQINTSLLGGNSVSILFRVDGNWNGQVFGLPENASWIRTANGYVLHIEPEGGTEVSDTAVYATNTARINNRIKVSALTGDNGIEGADTALISTGDAYAGANLINIANANVIGRNWMMAVVNIFGDFNGNIAFGRPDLWVGGVVNAPKNPDNGDSVAYRYTITNNGDSPANGIVVTDTFSPHVTPAPGAHEIDAAAGTVSWSIDRLDPGESLELSYEGTLRNIGGEAEVTNTIRAAQTETDNNYDDNTEVVTFFAGASFASSRRDDRRNDRNNDIELVRDGEATASIGDIVFTRSPERTVVSDRSNVSTQTLTIYNPTEEPIHNVTVHDLLGSAETRAISKESWFLGTIAPREELTISYTLSFAPDTKNNIYTFFTRFEGDGETRVIPHNGSVIYQAYYDVTYAAANFDAPTSRPSVVTRSAPEPEVAGAQVDAASPFVKTARAAGGTIEGDDQLLRLRPVTLIALALFTALLIYLFATATGRRGRP